MKGKKAFVALTLTLVIGFFLGSLSNSLFSGPKGYNCLEQLDALPTRKLNSNPTDPNHEKSWRVRNCGILPWNNYKLKTIAWMGTEVFTDDPNFPQAEVPNLSPRGEGLIKVKFQIPKEKQSGEYYFWFSLSPDEGRSTFPDSLKLLINIVNNVN